MNKFKTIVLSILGGMEVSFYIFSPAIIINIWVYLFGLESFYSIVIYILGFAAMMFRAFKVGWMKE